MRYITQTYERDLRRSFEMCIKYSVNYKCECKGTTLLEIVPCDSLFEDTRVQKQPGPARTLVTHGHTSSLRGVCYVYRSQVSG
jgi:hypothetical protein